MSLVLPPPARCTCPAWAELRREAQSAATGHGSRTHGRRPRRLCAPGRDGRGGPWTGRGGERRGKWKGKGKRTGRGAPVCPQHPRSRSAAPGHEGAAAPPAAPRATRGPPAPAPVPAYLAHRRRWSAPRWPCPTPTGSRTASCRPGAAPWRRAGAGLRGEEDEGEEEGPAVAAV